VPTRRRRTGFWPDVADDQDVGGGWTHEQNVPVGAKSPDLITARRMQALLRYCAHPGWCDSLNQRF